MVSSFVEQFGKGFLGVDLGFPLLQHMLAGLGPVLG
jgi:hypothetical protein